MKFRKYVGFALIVGLLIIVPFISKSPYFLHIMIMMAFNISLVLSYNFSVGEVGTLSLAHATFFGVGGYAAAILAMRSIDGISFWLELLIAILVAGVVALFIGTLSFRLPDRSFAIGTLAFAMIALQIAQNWIPVTNGPMCIVPVPKPQIDLPFGISYQLTSVQGYYFIALALALITFLFSNRLKLSRIGRAFNAVREGSTLAASIGINVLKYKMLAMVLGAVFAGSVGAVYAHYVKVMCPVELSFNMILNLLIMIYVGGVGSIRGAILGAVIFTGLPELLRMAPQLRMLLYGIILFLSTVFLPGGLETITVKLIDHVKRLFAGKSVSSE